MDNSEAAEKNAPVVQVRYEQVQRVFDYWRIRMAHKRAKLDEKRRKKIRMRLDDGYTEQDLIDAIDGCGLSDFHSGRNDRNTAYNDIELICRDAKHVDMFIALAEKVKVRKALAEQAARTKKEEDERLALEREARRLSNDSPSLKLAFTRRA